MRKRNQPGIAANRRHPFLTSLIEQREMWLLCVPIIAWVLLFCYYPMYGLLMAFVNYTPGKQIWECGFVGLKYFKQFINGNDFWRILRNTLAMSGLNITVGFIAPILFAFMLNELGNPKVKKLVQTASYLPHFISWVVAGTMVTTVLGTDGVVNDVLISLGSTKTRIQFLQKGEWYWWIITIVNIWKSLGWSAIIYLSAMAGVSEELCEAGAIDGMGRLGIAIHITLLANPAHDRASVDHAGGQCALRRLRPASDHRQYHYPALLGGYRYLHLSLRRAERLLFAGHGGFADEIGDRLRAGADYERDRPQGRRRGPVLTERRALS